MQLKKIKKDDMGATLTIRLKGDQLKLARALADKFADGNLSELIRYLIEESGPSLGPGHAKIP